MLSLKGSGGRYFGTAPEDAYVLTLGSLPAPVSEQWDFSDGGCTSSACRQAVDAVGDAAFNQFVNTTEPPQKICERAGVPGSPPRQECETFFAPAFADADQALNKQQTEYTTSERAATLSGVVATLDSVSTPGTDWDLSSLTAHFLEGLLNGFKGVFTGAWDAIKALWNMLKNWSEAYDALKQFIQPFVDLVQGKAGWKDILDLLADGLGEQIQELWNKYA
ncbi:hypothetical protein B5M42_020535 [Paenibacillus athensensis]|uniref:hypothetical protein n=1 Tax=Paenibacillus athensensis TaxID=1967502 RepID=UPI00106F6A77|nr:hypothetical protein [Paenibacillus athensensis]MCD1261190.1 hypothetical protein [Paenibacillus athensensis]